MVPRRRRLLFGQTIKEIGEYQSRKSEKHRTPF
jgi:hypothetical protein